MPQTTHDIPPPPKKEHDELSQRLGNLGLGEFADYLSSPWRIIWTNLVAGIFRGLGFVLGATVVLAVVTFVLVRVLGSLPWVGEFFLEVGQFVENIQSAAEAVNR